MSISLQLDAPLHAFQQVLALVIIAALRLLHLLLIIHLRTHARVCVGLAARRKDLVGQLLIVLPGSRTAKRQSQVSKISDGFRNSLRSAHHVDARLPQA